MQSKICTKCKLPKPLPEFGPEARSADRHRYSCLACDRLRHAAFHQRNKEKRNAKAKANRLANPEVDRVYSLKYRRKYIWRTMLQHAKKRAVKFGLDYDLDQHVEEIKARLEPMRCELTGTQLVPGAGDGSRGRPYFNTPSLDRIEPAKGYTYANVRIVCWAINAAMGTWGEATLRTIVTAWMSRG